MVVTESYNVQPQLGLQSDATNCLLMLSFMPKHHNGLQSVQVFMQD